MYVCMYIEDTPDNTNTMAADAMRWESRASEEMKLATCWLRYYRVGETN